MKIGVNLVSLEHGNIGGMEQYLRNLLWHTANRYDDYQLYLYLNSRNESTFQVQHNIRKVVISEDSLRREMQILESINKEGIDIWFCPLLNLEPKYIHIPSIVTIPDLQHEYFPEYFSKEVLQWRKSNLAFSVKHANAVLTLSEFSKKTIVQTFAVKDEKVHSIHLDASKEFNQTLDPKRLELVKQKYKLPDSYGLYPANTWPHKNHLKLLEAVKLLKEEQLIDVNIILTGSEQQASQKIKSFIESNGLKNQVKFIGYIDQEDMPFVFKAANYLVFPSLFEGFGIPLVEAMKTEIPIICSGEGSIPEVVGNSALLFNPRNPQDIADKIMQIQNSDIREDLIEKGKVQARKFSWEMCINETLKVFHEVFSQSLTDSNSGYPLVTVITPSYNQGKFIRETIESVLSQDYPNIEYIIMDGGSTDETVDILKSYSDDRIKWISEKDDGQADAVNKGIRQARGDYIGWLNSDDTFLPGAVRQAASFFQHQKDVDMLYGEGYYTKENGEIMDRYPTESFNQDRLAQNCFICQPTAFFRKEVFEKVGLLNKDLHLCMDYELWMRIGKQCEVAYIPYFFATSRMYEDNKTLSRRKEVFTEIIQTVRHHYGYVPLSWVYGYVDYRLGAERNLFFYVTVLSRFTYANRMNFSYAFKELAQILKSKLKHKLQKKKYNLEQYSDGWVSKLFVTSLKMSESLKPSAVVAIYIHGRNESPFRHALKIKAYIDNRYISEYVIREKGPFSIQIPFQLKDMQINLKLISNKSFVPQKLNINEDQRELAYIIEEINVQKEG